MTNEKELMINAGVELIDSEPVTFQEQYQARLRTMRYINRCLGGGEGYDNPFASFDPDTLMKLKTENDHFMKMILDLKAKNNKYYPLAIVPQCLKEFSVGAILVDSWGYDQTNIDFYCIVGKTGSFLVLLPMKKFTSAEVGFMTNYETPGEVDYTANPIKKKQKSTDGLSLRNYAGGGWCTLWKGDKVLSTHYA